MIVDSEHNILSKFGRSQFAKTFIYLGSLIDYTRNYEGEDRRYIRLARTSMSQLTKI